MEEQKQGGLEAVVSKEAAVQKKPSHKRFLSIARQLPNYFISVVAGAGLAVSLYFAGMSAYHAVDEFLSVDESNVAAAEASDEPSPYNGCAVYCMIFVMCAMGGASFGYAMVASIKEAKEKIQEEQEKR